MAAFLIIAGIEKQSKCPSTYERMNRMWDDHTLGKHLAT